MKKMIFVLSLFFVAGLGFKAAATDVMVDNSVKIVVVDDDKKPCPADCTCANCQAKAADGKTAAAKSGEAKKDCAAKKSECKTAEAKKDCAKKCDGSTKTAEATKEKSK
ncbi:MAG: hypothetical protein AB7E36_02855 [Salinivirgaceae bacterium]